MPEFRLPDLGEGVHEGQIVRLHAKVGDAVKEDDPFLEVETDKAAVEIAAPFTGTIEKWHVNEGQVVNVGDVMVTYAEDVSKSGASESKAATATEIKRARAAKGPANSVAGATVAESKGSSSHRSPGGRASVRDGRGKPASPATRKLARELGVELEKIDGSGPGGRITRADIERAARHPTSRADQLRAPAARSPARPRDAKRRATDTDRRPTDVGAHVQITDLSSIPGEDASDQYGPVRLHPLTQARKTIAANMAQSWSEIPHVTDHDDADATDLEALRRGYPAAENEFRKLTMLVFVIRAVSRALGRHSHFNAQFDAENQQIIFKRYINIAVGVQTKRGLVTPVVRDADQAGILEIADALDDIVKKARDGTFTVNETRGGTYTVSNAGAYGGSRYSTPIVPPGQCAVLAIGRTKMMPWVVDGSLQPRLVMPLSHSFDHRIADGAQEILFLRDVIEQLENPARVML